MKCNIRLKKSICVFAPPFLGGEIKCNVRCSSYANWKMRTGLPITVNWTFSLGITAEVLRANIDWKSAFSLQLGQFGPTFRVEGVANTNDSSSQKITTKDLSFECRQKFLSFCQNPGVCQTDGRRERPSQYRALHYTPSHGKNSDIEHRLCCDKTYSTATDCWCSDKYSSCKCKL